MNSTGSQSRGPWFVTQRYVASTCANSPDADARLRAAAPTMLEALEKCVALLTEFQEYHDGDKPCGSYDAECPISMGEWFTTQDRADLEAARAAIKQARGQ